MTTRTPRSTADITQELIDRCIRHNDGDVVYYEVESRTTAGVTYDVRYNRDRHCYTCTCPAGSPPVLNTGELAWTPRRCWHIKASIAHAFAYRAKLERVEELKNAGLTRDEAFEAVEHTLLVDGQPADIETLVRVFSSKEAYPSEKAMDAQAQAFTSAPFSLLR